MIALDDLLELKRKFDALPHPLKRIWMHSLSDVNDLGLLVVADGDEQPLTAYQGVPIVIRSIVEPGCAELEFSDGTFQHVRLRKKAP